MAESRNRGESVDLVRDGLARDLDAAGHPQCAEDLAGASVGDAAQVAYDIAEHVEYDCGCPHGGHPELAQRLREWADDLEPGKAAGS